MEQLYDKQRFSENVPIWSVVVTQMLNDMSSNVFPTSNDHVREPRGFIRFTR
jgi:hypothetical protein